MSTISIELPDEMKQVVELKATEGGCASLGDYVQDILRVLHGQGSPTLDEIKEMLPDEEFAARLQEPQHLQSLEAKLLDGLHSSGVVVDEAFWENGLQKLRDKYPNIDCNSGTP